jgi:hypothetical protein
MAARDGRLIRKGKWFSAVKGQAVLQNWHGATVWNTPNSHRFSNILEILRPISSRHS